MEISIVTLLRVKGSTISVMDGEWSDNFPHGKGAEIFSNGEEYNGSWVKGKKCGYG